MSRVHHELLPLGDKRLWDEAAARTPHVPAHDHDHVAAFQASSHDPHFLYVCRNDLGEVEVVCPVAVRTDSAPDLYTPYGLGGFASRRPLPWFSAEWNAFAERSGWITSYIAMNPLLVTDLGFPSDVTRPAGDLFIVDLRPGLDVVSRSMSRSRRATLARWDLSPGTITTDRSWILDFLRREADGHFGRRSARDTYFFSHGTWERLLSSPSVIATAAVGGAGLSACCIVGTSARSADFLFGISRPGGESYSAPLIWEAMKDLHGAGVQTLNLGGGIRDGDGVAEFKRRFGAVRTSMTTFQVVHDPERYARLCQESGSPAAEASGFFPPYRRKQG